MSNNLCQINSTGPYMNINSLPAVGRVGAGSAPSTPNRNGMSKIVGTGKGIK